MWALGICGSQSHFIVSDQAEWTNGYGWHYMCKSCPNGAWGNDCNGQEVPCCA